MKDNVLINVQQTGENFRNIREFNGLSKIELSKALKGVPINLIDDIEKGKYIPTLEFVFDFCMYFSVSIDEVIVSML